MAQNMLPSQQYLNNVRKVITSKSIPRRELLTLERGLVTSASLTRDIGRGRWGFLSPQEMVVWGIPASGSEQQTAITPFAGRNISV